MPYLILCPDRTLNKKLSPLIDLQKYKVVPCFDHSLSERLAQYVLVSSKQDEISYHLDQENCGGIVAIDCDAQVSNTVKQPLMIRVQGLDLPSLRATLELFHTKIDLETKQHYRSARFFIKLMRQRYLRLFFDIDIEKKIFLTHGFMKRMSIDNERQRQTLNALVFYELAKMTLHDSLLVKPQSEYNNVETTLFNQIPLIASRLAAWVNDRQTETFLKQFAQVNSNQKISLNLEFQIFILINIFTDCAQGFYQKHSRGFSFAKAKILELVDCFSQDLVTEYLNFYDSIAYTTDFERYIPWKYLNVGMILAQDLSTKDEIVLAKNHGLTELDLLNVHKIGAESSHNPLVCVLSKTGADEKK